MNISQASIVFIYFQQIDIHLGKELFKGYKIAQLNYFMKMCQLEYKF